MGQAEMAETKWSGLAVRIMARDLADNAATCAKAESRSVGRQVEYWARVGRLALLNPDVPVSVICKTMLGIEQAAAGNIRKVDLHRIASGRK